MEDYLNCLRKYADFSGRATRREFWHFFVWNAIIGVLMGFASALSHQRAALFLRDIYTLAVLLPSMAVSIRRFHDTGRSAFSYFCYVLALSGCCAVLPVVECATKPVSGLPHGMVLFFTIVGIGAMLLIPILGFLFLKVFAEPSRSDEDVSSERGSRLKSGRKLLVFWLLFILVSCVLGYLLDQRRNRNRVDSSGRSESTPVSQINAAAADGVCRQTPTDRIDVLLNRIKVPAPDGYVRLSADSDACRFLDRLDAADVGNETVARYICSEFMGEDGNVRTGVDFSRNMMAFRIIKALKDQTYTQSEFVVLRDNVAENLKRKMDENVRIRRLMNDAESSTVGVLKEAGIEAKARIGEIEVADVRKIGNNGLVYGIFRHEELEVDGKVKSGIAVLTQLFAWSEDRIFTLVRLVSAADRNEAMRVQEESARILNIWFASIQKASHEPACHVATVKEGLYKIVNLRDGSVTYLDGVPIGGWTEEYKTTKLVLRRIEPGAFMMGSHVEEKGRFPGEKQHRVALTAPYYLGVFEVTQSQWESVMGTNPSKFRDSICPVERVSYNDIRGCDLGAG